MLEKNIKYQDTKNNKKSKKLTWFKHSFLEQFQIECCMHSKIYLVLVYFTTWLVQKTDINQIQTKNQP